MSSLITSPNSKFFRLEVCDDSIAINTTTHTSRHLQHTVCTGNNWSCEDIVRGRWHWQLLIHCGPTGFKTGFRTDLMLYWRPSDNSAAKLHSLNKAFTWHHRLLSSLTWKRPLITCKLQSAGRELQQSQLTNPTWFTQHEHMGNSRSGRGGLSHLILWQSHSSSISGSWGLTRHPWS